MICGKFLLGETVFDFLSRGFRFSVEIEGEFVSSNFILDIAITINSLEIVPGIYEKIVIINKDKFRLYDKILRIEKKHYNFMRKYFHHFIYGYKDNTKDYSYRYKFHIYTVDEKVVLIKDDIAYLVTKTLISNIIDEDIIQPDEEIEFS